MIVGGIKTWKLLKGLEGLEPAFNFLEDSRAAALSPGKHPVDGDRIYALVVKGPSCDPESSQFESHRKYIDVQYLVSGMEMIGVAPLDRLTVSQPYQEDSDAALYHVPNAYSKLEMQPGRFAVFFPEDGHMPQCHLNGQHELHKIVVKVSMELRKELG